MENLKDNYAGRTHQKENFRRIIQNTKYGMHPDKRPSCVKQASCLIIHRAWAMPNGATFTIKPIRELLDRVVGDGVGWIDPFAGNNSPAEFTNDLDLETSAKSHELALDFVTRQKRSFSGCLFDPPYSSRQVSELYHRIKRRVHMDDTNTYFYSSVRNVLMEKIELGGFAVCFGWNSNGFGLVRGFELQEVLLVAHGGAHNDTIVTIEKKVGSAYGQSDATAV